MKTRTLQTSNACTSWLRWSKPPKFHWHENAFSTRWQLWKKPKSFQEKIHCLTWLLASCSPWSQWYNESTYWKNQILSIELACKELLYHHKGSSSSFCLRPFWRWQFRRLDFPYFRYWVEHLPLYWVEHLPQLWHCCELYALGDELRHLHLK